MTSEAGKLRLWFDDDIFSIQAHGGISRYFTELIVGLRGRPEVRSLDVPTFSMTPAAHTAGISRPLPSKLSRRPAIRLANRAVYQAKRPHDLERGIVHHTYYSGEYLRQYRRAEVRVSTLYDFTPELFPDAVGPKGHLRKNDYIEQSGALLCISETTKQDLLRIHGSVAAHVAVTPLAVHPRFRPVPRNELHEYDFPFVLYVGGRFGYKEFGTALAGFSLVAPRTDLHLLVVGFPPQESELDRISALGLTGRVHFVTLPDEGLVAAYQRATAFVFPSAYEGFGLPTLEAMASGCPVVTSDAPALVEVGGDAALTFPVGDADAMAKRIEELLYDDETRQSLVSAGLRRAQDFSWEKTVDLTLDAYRAVSV